MASAFYIFLLILVMMLLFAFGFKALNSAMRQTQKKRGKYSTEAGNPGICPVCGIALEGKQKIQSAVFPGGNGRICHIFGCPACLSPSALSGTRRACPVCKKKLKESEYLIARFFEHTGRKNHVHILGCVHCRIG